MRPRAGHRPNTPSCPSLNNATCDKPNLGGIIIQLIGRSQVFGISGKVGKTTRSVRMVVRAGVYNLDCSGGCVTAYWGMRRLKDHAVNAVDEFAGIAKDKKCSNNGINHVMRHFHVPLSATVKAIFDDGTGFLPAHACKMSWDCIAAPGCRALVMPRLVTATITALDSGGSLRATRPTSIAMHS